MCFFSLKGSIKKYKEHITTFNRYFNIFSLFLRTEKLKVVVIFNDMTILLEKVVNNNK